MDQKNNQFNKLRTGFLFLILSSFFYCSFSQEITTTEKKVILIFKFAEYIEWENEDNIDTLKFGIYSDDVDLISSLRIFETVKIRDKVISLVRFYNIKEISDIQMLILSNDKNYQIDAIAEQTNNNQILIVSDKCKNQEHLMINFIYSNNKKLEFEVNKANILKERMSVKPELLLLGGTEVDIADLYEESQKSLGEIQKKVDELESKYNDQLIELDNRNKLLKYKNEEIYNKTENIQLQNKEIEKQKGELDLLSKKVTEQDNKLEQDLNALKGLKNQLEERSKEIQKSDNILKELNEEINEKQKKIDSQETRITGYESTVDQQKTIIYLAIISLAMLLILVIFVYRGFINKKKTAQKLAEKEAEIRMLFDIAPLPVVMIDFESGKSIYINQLGQDMFKLNTKNATKYIQSKDYFVNDSQRDEIFEELNQNKRIDNVEVLLRDRQENQFYGSVSGLITKYENKKVFFLAIKDISDIKNAVEELNSYKDHLEILVKVRSQKLIESQNRFKNLAELLPETIFEMNPKGKISFINKRGKEMFHLNDVEISKELSLFSFLDESDSKEMKSLIKSLISGKRLQTTEFNFTRNDQSAFPAIIYMNYHQKEKDTPIIRGIIVDITERKNLERKILNTMIETEEKERKRFAEDLHDGLGSLLSSLNLYVDMIDNPELLPEEKEKLFSTLRGIIDESIKNSKEISNNLRPSTLSKFGLTGSLQSFCNKINDTKKINISLDYSGLNKQLNTNIENALYRITNELINNTIKYASAKNAWIQLENTNGTLSLYYKDDGIGFDKKMALKSDGMGLKNIYTRVNSIDGTCNIKSKKGEGTTVTITVKTDT